MFILIAYVLRQGRRRRGGDQACRRGQAKHEYANTNTNTKHNMLLLILLLLLLACRRGHVGQDRCRLRPPRPGET